MAATISAENQLRNIEPVSLRDQVFDEIQRAILERRLNPGDRIREQELTNHLNVSRTPVREALVLLERDGLITTIPHRGAFVRVFNEGDIREIFAMRTALEGLAADLSIKRIKSEHLAYMEASIERVITAIENKDKPEQNKIDLDFHRYLVFLSDNSRLMNAWRVIAVQYTAVGRYFDISDINKQIVVNDHKAITDAYRRKDVEAILGLFRSINDRMATIYIEAYRAQIEQAATPDKPS